LIRNIIVDNIGFSFKRASDLKQWSHANCDIVKSPVHGKFQSFVKQRERIGLDSPEDKMFIFNCTPGLPTTAWCRNGAYQPQNVVFEPNVRQYWPAAFEVIGECP
jgi:hypothetical protein